MGNFGQISHHVAQPLEIRRLSAVTPCVAMAICLQVILGNMAIAMPPASGRVPSLEATTSETARRDAAQSIPLKKISTGDRSKIESVISNPSIFRRMPVRVVDCDPDLYLFLVRHPDVVVNVWEVLKLSQLKLRQIEDNQFQIAETDGTTAQFHFAYQSHDMHVLYGEGLYDGPLLAKPVKGRGVLVLKCGYVRETNGRYYITSRLDCFLTIEPAGAELIGKTVSPFFGKTLDNNFIQTVAFVGSLSRTAELNSRGLERLTGHLIYVRPEVRSRFLEITANMAQKADVIEASRTQDHAAMATHPEAAQVR